MPLMVSSTSPEVSPEHPMGRLFVVGTPIGNLEDITLRAIRTLKEVDLIACEDTQHTQKLLHRYSIKTQTISYHQHNEMTRAPELIIELEAGRQVALVSDAGMPGISDPGFRLIHLAIRHEIPVVPVPGASAFVAALAASGLAVDRFRFLGFLPSKKLARQKTLRELEYACKTMVFYESPNRVVAMLEDVLEIFGDRQVVVAREVTKVHEEFLRGPASEVLETLTMKPVKGEITILVGPPVAPVRRPSSVPSIITELGRVMTEDGLDQRDALKVVARRLGISKSEAYRQWQAEKRFALKRV